MGKAPESWLTRLKKNHSLSFDIVFFSLSFLVVMIMLVTGYSHFHNKAAILNLSEDLIDQVNKRIINNTTNYLFKAVDIAELSSEITTESIQNLNNNKSLESLMVAILKTQPRLNTFFLGNENGDFLMLRRELNKTFSTKSIKKEGASQTTKWKYRNLEGKVISEKDDPNDKYDPRTRPWYKGAKEKNGTFWSDIYIFYTGKIPGVTTSQPVRQDGKLIGVIGLDIPLVEISNFMKQIEDELKEQKLGKAGTAFIVNNKDEIIAFHDYNQAIIKEECSLYSKQANNEDHKTAEIEKFKKEFESKKASCGVLILNVAKEWTVAGFNDKGDFIQIQLKNNEELAMDLDKANPQIENNATITNLSTSKIGRTIIRPRKINELGIKPVEDSFQLYRNNKKLIFSFASDGKRYIASYKHFPQNFQNDWTIGLIVPEQDLIGAIVETNNMMLTVSVIILISAILLGFILNQLKQALKKRNEFIRSTFGRYLSDDIVDSILESPKGTQLGGEKRKVTIMMTDLRGFTSLSEGLPAETCVSMINLYLDTMTEIILKYKGTIDEFIGDAILVIFGAPVQKEDDAKRAVACALEMQLAMEIVNQKNRELGFPEVAMGIGINTGDVVVGNIGSSKRTKYGVVGSNVNLTSRVESYTVGGQTYISEDTKKECGDLLRIDGQMEVKPKGVKNNINIYEVGGIGGEFNVYLPEKKRLELQVLKSPAKMDFLVLAGKHAGKDIQKGFITKITNKDAELQSNVPLHKLDNLQLVLLDDSGNELINELYAKVTEVIEENKLVHINFTSIPQPFIEKFNKFMESKR